MERLEISLRKLEISREHDAWIGMTEDRNSKDLTEAEENKRWQEYTEEQAKMVLLTRIITMMWSLT